MAATPAEINSYLLNITDAQSDYGEKIAKYHRLGRPNISCDNLKLIILGYYVRILEKYFDDDYENNNFFTTEEAKDIMERINKICKTYIYLKI